MERMKLVNTLSNLVPEQLEKIILILKPPAGVIPHFSAPQIQRVSKLLEWAESPTGCGLQKVREILDESSPNPDPFPGPPENTEEPSPSRDPFPGPPENTEEQTPPKKFPNIKKVLLLGVLSLLGISLPLGILFRITTRITPACELGPQDEWLSCGEKALTQLGSGSNKEDGIKAYANKNYDDAVKFLDQAWQQTKDAETLIYLNNAKLKRDNQDKIFTIAVVIPLDISEEILNTKYLSKNILEGVAQKQKEFNDISNDWKLQILIANDGKNIDQGQKLADQLVKRDIIAVMGHYSSQVNMSVKSIYEDHKIVLLSASSAASNLTNRGDDTFFFRLVNTTEYQSQVLAEYLKDKGHKKLALFAIHKRKEKPNKQQKKLGFSVAFSSDFRDQWSSFGSDYKIVYDPDLEDKDPVTEQLKKAKQKQAEVIVLCPDVKENMISRAKEVIAENKNKLLITGCSALNHKYYSDINPLYYHKLIISAWNDSKELIKNYEDFWRPAYGNKYDVSRYALSYDAIQVLIDTINQSLKKGTKPSSSDLQKILTDPTFETEGLTGPISFRGSERGEKTIKIVKPDCPDPNSNDNCKWIEVKPPLSQGKN